MRHAMDLVEIARREGRVDVGQAFRRLGEENPEHFFNDIRAAGLGQLAQRLDDSWVQRGLRHVQRFCFCADLLTSSRASSCGLTKRS